MKQFKNSTAKYRNRKVEVDGILFDSKKEGKRWLELKEMESAGEISELRRQVRIELIPKTDKYRACTYVADFVYTDRNGETVYEDCKGYKGGSAYQIFKLKKKFAYWKEGIDIIET